ncbi:hypothetical protein OUZ56_018585 [Daphnia magna]|uniref:Secreted protein n=1 Tax=Daphnia magna TaxID=35525 RepID=A0ABQ9Z985_9CRUS|nr:hypothetical protein OUZ56_018585 [Daphnia magna]
MVGVPCVSVMIGVPCVNTICFIYSWAVISTPALVRGDSQAARKGGCCSSARSLIQRSTQVDFITYKQRQFFGYRWAAILSNHDI